MKVAVVVPALNEAAAIGLSLRRLADQGPDELVVVDGGSDDATVSIARQAGAAVMASRRGRAAQQNAGAGATRSGLLLFLHADCHLEAGSIAFLRRFGGRHPRVPGGCFRMRVESGAPVYRAIDAAADLRAAAFGLPYGDQGIFARREVFESLGGFPDVPIMEDVFFSLRLRTLGRVAVLPRRVFVSPRRWQARGVVRQSLTNWALTAAAAARVSPSRLGEFYPAVR